MGGTVLTIQAGAPFADTLARGLIARLGDDPLALAGATIYLPTRRAGRTLAESFARVLRDGLCASRRAGARTGALSRRLRAAGRGPVEDRDAGARGAGRALGRRARVPVDPARPLAGDPAGRRPDEPRGLQQCLARRAGAPARNQAAGRAGRRGGLDRQHSGDGRSARRDRAAAARRRHSARPRPRTRRRKLEQSRSRPSAIRDEATARTHRRGARGGRRLATLAAAWARNPDTRNLAARAAHPRPSGG